MEQPYVGQMVHFVDGGAYAGRHLAAVIVWVWSDTAGEHTVVNLNVQNPGTSFPTTEPVTAQHSIPHDKNQAMGTWHFIEKPVEAAPAATIANVTQTVNAGSSVKHGK